MHFTNAMCTTFEKFLTLFQTKAPLVHVLYDQLVELLTALLVRFMKADVVTAAAKDSPEKLANIDVENVNSHLSSDDLSIGETTRSELRKLKSDAQRKAILGMRAFFTTATKFLQTRLPLSNKLLKHLSCLEPKKKAIREHSHSIGYIAKMFNMSAEHINKVTDE